MHHHLGGAAAAKKVRPTSLFVPAFKPALGPEALPLPVKEHTHDLHAVMELHKAKTISREIEQKIREKKLDSNLLTRARSASAEDRGASHSSSSSSAAFDNTGRVITSHSTSLGLDNREGTRSAVVESEDEQTTSSGTNSFKDSFEMLQKDSTSPPLSSSPAASTPSITNQRTSGTKRTELRRSGEMTNPHFLGLETKDSRASSFSYDDGSTVSSSSSSGPSSPEGSPRPRNSGDFKPLLATHRRTASTASLADDLAEIQASSSLVGSSSLKALNELQKSSKMNSTGGGELNVVEEEDFEDDNETLSAEEPAVSEPGSSPSKPFMALVRSRSQRALAKRKEKKEKKRSREEKAKRHAKKEKELETKERKKKDRKKKDLGDVLQFSSGDERDEDRHEMQKLDLSSITGGSQSTSPGRRDSTDDSALQSAPSPFSSPLVSRQEIRTSRTVDVPPIPVSPTKEKGKDEKEKRWNMRSPLSPRSGGGGLQLFRSSMSGFPTGGDKEKDKERPPLVARDYHPGEKEKDRIQAEKETLSSLERQKKSLMDDVYKLSQEAASLSKAIEKLEAKKANLLSVCTKLEEDRRAFVLRNGKVTPPSPSVLGGGGFLPSPSQKKKLKKEDKVSTGISGNLSGELAPTGIVTEFGRLLSAMAGRSGALVYTCFVNGWECAAKQIDLTSSRPAKVESLQREIDILASIPPHPNIVRYLGHESSPTKLTLYMCKYDCTLRSVLDEQRKKGERYSPLLIARYASEILAGVQYLHGLSIMHRDIKADNIFVRMDNRQISKLVVGDFDTAKRVTTTSRTCSFVGTPGFMAAEVFHQNGDQTREYTFKADVFSYGMLLYELITLKRPYEEIEMPVINIFDEVEKGVPPRVQACDLNSMYSSLIAIHRSCVQRIAEDRPSLEKVKEDLQAVANAAAPEGGDEKPSPSSPPM